MTLLTWRLVFPDTKQILNLLLKVRRPEFHENKNTQKISSQGCGKTLKNQKSQLLKAAMQTSSWNSLKSPQLFLVVSEIYSAFKQALHWTPETIILLSSFPGKNMPSQCWLRDSFYVNQCLCFHFSLGLQINKFYLMEKFWLLLFS